MTPDQISAARKICEAATPGPLFASPNYLIGGWWVQTEEMKAKEHECGDFANEGNAKLFAAARTGWPEALTALEEAYAKIKRLEVSLAEERRELGAAVDAAIHYERTGEPPGTY